MKILQIYEAYKDDNLLCKCYIKPNGVITQWHRPASQDPSINSWSISTITPKNLETILEDIGHLPSEDNKLISKADNAYFVINMDFIRALKGIK